MGLGLGLTKKSKTLAERAAWDFIEKEGGSLELSVVNPANIMGPVLGPEHVYFHSRFVNPMSVPVQCQDARISSSGIVDVRDVMAHLHLLL